MKLSILGKPRLILVLILVISAVFLYISFQSKRSKIVPTPVLLPTVSKGSAKLTLKLSDDRRVLRQGQPVILIVSADSKGVPVTGYDINLLYSNGAFKFKRFDGMNIDFRTTTSTVSSSYSNGGKLIVTGVVPPGIKAPILKNNILGTIIFEPTNNLVGLWDFSLEYDQNRSKKDSNIIDTKSRDILTEVDDKDVAVTYGQPVTITKGQQVVVRDETIKNKILLYVRLLSTSIAERGCFDCITEAKIEFSKIPEFLKTQTVEFRSGGITGQTALEKTVFSCPVFVESIQKDKVTILVSCPGG